VRDRYTVVRLNCGIHRETSEITTLIEHDASHGIFVVLIESRLGSGFETDCMVGRMTDYDKQFPLGVGVSLKLPRQRDYRVSDYQIWIKGYQ
jgi:hypothetical protein